MIKAGELNEFVKDLRDKLCPREDGGNEADDRERYQGKVKTISGVAYWIGIAKPHDREA